MSMNLTARLFIRSILPTAPIKLTALINNRAVKLVDLEHTTHILSVNYIN